MQSCMHNNQYQSYVSIADMNAKLGAGGHSEEEAWLTLPKSNRKSKVLNYIQIVQYVHCENDRLGCCAALYLHLHWQSRINKLDNSVLRVRGELKCPSSSYFTEQWNDSSSCANPTVAIYFYREAPVGLVINQQPKRTPVMQHRLMGFRTVFYTVCVFDVYLYG